MNEPRHPNGHDPLLQRYHEANALDPARPDPALRERVLARAREQAVLNARTQPVPPRPEAANDRLWTLRALGSLAVLGLVGLLALQFDRSPPEEREVALGTATVRAPVNAPGTVPAAPAVAPAMTPPADTSAAAPASPLPAPRPAAKAAPPAHADRAPQPLPEPAPARPSPAPAASAPPAPAADVAAETPPAGAAIGHTEAPASRSEAAPPTAAPAAAPAAAEQSMPAPMMRSRPAARMAAPMAAPVSPAAGTDALGRTPLMLAAARGDAALVERLLAAGADRSPTDHQGWTAADHARHAGHEALAQRLAPPMPQPVDGAR